MEPGPGYQFFERAIFHSGKLKGVYLECLGEHRVEIANLFLDELIHHPESDFDSVFAKTFQINPLQFAGMEDGPLKELVARSRLHFENLKKAIREDLPAEGIERTACCLEPSFYAREYGIQGRLDLLCQTGKKTAIVELKSSKLYKPNQYGLNANNYVQTLLYDLLIRAAFGRQTDPRNYILYSSQAARALRYAPVVKSQQHEAMAVRNQLLGYEYRLASMGSNTVLGKGDLLEQGERLLRIIQSRQSEDRFFGEDCQRFLSVIGSADETEKRYFFAFCGFIAREQQLAKSGWTGGGHRCTGTVWLYRPPGSWPWGWCAPCGRTTVAAIGRRRGFPGRSNLRGYRSRLLFL
ncbi:MAG: PD-(D/E)XK nuclease family protein, partial [Haliscomenobacter sp.]